MPAPFKAGPEVYAMAQDLISSKESLAHLGPIDDQILIVMKEKATQKGGVEIAGVTSKASLLLELVADHPYKFLITLAGDVWSNMSPLHQEALLMHQLLCCGLEENPDTGDMRCFVRIPDVAFFREEVQEYGFWRTSDSKPAPDIITDLFGEAIDDPHRFVKKTKTRGKGKASTNPPAASAP